MAMALVNIHDDEDSLHSCVDCLLSMHCLETSSGKITGHYSLSCTVAFCYVHTYVLVMTYHIKICMHTE